MTPNAAYQRINKLIWLGRLPKAEVVFVDPDMIPSHLGFTNHDDGIFIKPVITLARRKRWGLTLVHEILHVAEPNLDHGPVFDFLVRRYWRMVKKNLKGFQKI